MALVIQRYGDSPVSDVDAMRRVAQRIVVTCEAGNTVVVVVSAMGGTTNELLDQTVTLVTSAPTRGMGILLSAGERISVTLLATAASELGILTRAYTSTQAEILTDSKYDKASIVDVLPERVAHSIQIGSVAIVAGLQGISEVKDAITLGRGGSDTTAVTLAAALNADVYEIYTDVDGLFTANPYVVPAAKRIESLSSEETLELAAHGAKVLHLRTIEYTRRFGVPLHVRSSFSDKTGAQIYDGRREGAPVPSVVAAQLDDVVTADTDSVPNAPSVASPTAPQSAGATPTSPSDPAGLDEGPSASVIDTAYRNAIATRAQTRPRPPAEEDHVEAPAISGIAHDCSQNKITLMDVPDVPSAAAHIFAIVTGTDANIDMIVQDVSARGTDLTNIFFTCLDGDSAAARGVLEAACEELGFRNLHFNPDVGILSLAGTDMRSDPGVSARLSGSLSKAGANIHMVSTPEIRISVMADDAVLDETMRAVRSASGLDAQVVEVIAYGGTGQ